MPLTLLHVAEKPSVAKSIANALCSSGRPRISGGGRNAAPPVYEFDASIGGYTNAHHLVTGVAGHLKNLDFASPFNEWSACNPIELFHAPITSFVPDDKKAMQAQLETLSRRSQVLVLWLDCDREGEGIAYEVIDVCTAVNARLTLRRAKFSATTERDIRNAMAALVNPDKRLADAVNARSELDLRLGAAFTRLQTVSLAKRFNELMGKIISYGPCQFPTLGFVVQRYNDITAFVREPFWEIRMTYGGDGTQRATNPRHNNEDNEDDDDDNRTSSNGSTVTFGWDRGRVYDELSGVVMYEQALKAGTATVVSVDGRTATKNKPIPLNSVDFAMFASRYLKMNSQTAAKIAEELYQKGFISYPRTETQIFDETINVRGLVGEHCGHPVWGDYATRLMGGGFETPSRGKTHDKAHPPIHPLRPALQTDFQAFDHWRIYEFITRHFLACCSKNAIGTSAKVTASIGDEKFTASGLTVTERNFLDIYPYQKWTTNALPAFSVGSTFIPSSLLLHKGSTEPPPLLAEHDLIAMMNAHGIGTDATIPEHISKVQEREYMIKNEQARFTPTTLGVALLRGYERLSLEAMLKPFLRASVERDLQSVCEGTKRKDDVIRDCIQHMIPVYEQTAKNLQVLVAAMAELFEPLGVGAPISQSNVSVCGACKQRMHVCRAATDSDEFALFCPRCREGFNLPRGTRRVEPVDHTCPLCEYQVVKTDGGKTLCPRCFVDTPAEYSSYSVKKQSTFVPAAGVNTDCAHCTNTACNLAGSTMPRGAAKTPESLRLRSPIACCLGACDGWMIPRRTQQGTWMMGCSNSTHSQQAGTGCTHVIWFPKSVTQVVMPPQSDPASLCTECSRQEEIAKVYKIDVTYTNPSTTGASDATLRTVRMCICCARHLCDGIMEKPSNISVAQARTRLRERCTTATLNPQPASVVDIEDIPARAVVNGGVTGVANGGAGAVPSHSIELGGRFLQPAQPKVAERRGTNGLDAARYPPSASAGRGGEPPLCKAHGKPCVVRQSRNNQKEFWCCPEQNGCGFQSWCDSTATVESGGGYNGGGGGGGGGGGVVSTFSPPPAATITRNDSNRPAATLGPPPTCEMHRTEAVLRTAGPSSKDPGAKFWVCPSRGAKGTPDDCGLFVWLGHVADDAGPTTAATAPTAGHKRPRPAGGEPGDGNTGGSAPKKPRRCTVCKAEGHTKAKCPHSLDNKFGDDIPY